MSELTALVGMGLLGIVGMCFGTYALLKTQFSNDKLAEKLEFFIEDIANNPDMQQKLYLIGGLLGKGLIDGTGMAGLGVKRGGKLNMNDIIMQLVAGFAQKYIQPPTGNSNNPYNNP